MAGSWERWLGEVALNSGGLAAAEGAQVSVHRTDANLGHQHQRESRALAGLGREGGQRPYNAEDAEKFRGGREEVGGFPSDSIALAAGLPWQKAPRLDG
jgi:hypothetical protein